MSDLFIFANMENAYSPNTSPAGSRRTSASGSPSPSSSFSSFSSSCPIMNWVPTPPGYGRMLMVTSVGLISFPDYDPDLQQPAASSSSCQDSAAGILAPSPTFQSVSDWALLMEERINCARALLQAEVPPMLMMPMTTTPSRPEVESAAPARLPLYLRGAGRRPAAAAP
ncbi:hypothetical protein HYH02_010866 [Chlamydomonas schloesseri]|uniref:Uncharacterized protein n=1 Tax=Chlamydomonas schloesseri TaxID=2026947 RepID=A0A835TDL3_9CHLO|nr:hypothetical protein HYH02_010864 [Chlamydomonas schloesseri]KAG2438411.1 hypothetical protein HYH02_010866 [Chlamydomonas schloesseri]|eukprot:KAG2438409.1 hypothetical protein HYH02_010864 [Chlamydomonas schloesseri]